MATYGDVLRVREFRALMIAATLSDLGDQLARVALTVLVYQRTGSPLLAASVFAATYLPSLLGGPLLSSLADRRPGREVMVVCDVVRAYLVLLMAVGSPPIWLLLVLLLAVETCAVPFDAARAALVPEVLDGDAYVVGTALSTAQHQICMVAGYGVAGAALAVLSVPGALALDALTFAASAALVHLRLRARPAADVDVDDSAWRAVVRGIDAVRRTPQVLVLLLVAWAACGVSVVDEALAAAYVAAHDLPTSAVGLLLAASPAGTAVGGAVLTRLVPAEHRMRLLVPLLGLCALPLLLVPLAPSFPVVLALLAVSGTGATCLVLASTTIARAVDPAVRGRVWGVAASGLMVSQGVGVLSAGGLASVVHVHVVYAGAGALGLVLTAVLGVAWARRGAPVEVPVQRPAPAAPAVPAGHVP